MKDLVFEVDEDRAKKAWGKYDTISTYENPLHGETLAVAPRPAKFSVSGCWVWFCRVD